MSLSIRWRLTLWNSLALAVVLLGFAGLVYGLLHRALYQQVDRKLRAGLHQLNTDPQLAGDGLDDRLRHWIYELFEHERVFGAVYTPEGQLRLRTEELAAVSIPAPLPPWTYTLNGPVDRQLPRSRSTTIVALTDEVVPALGRQRLLRGHMAVDDQARSIVLMTSLEDVDHELARLAMVLLWAVPVGLAVAAGIAYLLARKALAPIEQLQRQTGQITAAHLERRLPVVNPGDELGQLATTINAMVERLERSFTEVRRFTADASHELRTPLTALRAELEAALRQPALPAAQQRHLLGSLLEECQRLSKLTDQLLTLARQDAGVAPVADEPVRLTGLVGGVVATMRLLAQDKGIELRAESETDIEVRGDASRLRQVFYNLIENAIKYTPAGGKVRVRVDEEDKRAVVRVHDEGVGIAAEHLPRVFDRFYRVDKARSREEGGTGLGLSIARSIVVAHGGTIDLESSPGRGTTCVVSLPCPPGSSDGIHEN
jgi:two-component system, OmpR family, heavy metal sensor histidine kinase CusS